MLKLTDDVPFRSLLTLGASKGLTKLFLTSLYPVLQDSEMFQME